MPKRVLDFEAIWTSDRLAACAVRARSEYVWMYGLANANGNFEVGNARAIYYQVYGTLRPDVSIADVAMFLEEFKKHGLLYTWHENGKVWGHWVGSQKPGRLPSKSECAKYNHGPVARPDSSKLNAYQKQCDAVVAGAEPIPAREPPSSLPEQEPEPLPFPAGELCPHCLLPECEIIPVGLFQQFKNSCSKTKAMSADRVDLLKRQLLDLHVSGQDVIKVLEQSIRRGYTDVFPVKQNGDASGNGHAAYSAPPPIQYVKSEFGPIRDRTPEEQAGIDKVFEDWIKEHPEDAEKLKG